MIRDIVENNEKISIDSIRKEKLKDVIDKFTDTNGNFDLKNFKDYIESDGKNVVKEGYSLNFLGKRASELLSGLESTTVFVPDIEHNSKEENKNSENIYISADNLEALRHLKHSYHNKIKCIYIDPPYNTGKDGFCYNDIFKFTKESLKEKLDLYDDDEANRILSMVSLKSNSHSAWLSFMYPRLLLANELLADDGLMFISIDDNELFNLKLLCDEVFNEENMILNMVVNRTSEIATSVSVQKHEYMLCYAKNIENFSNRNLQGNRYVVSRGTIGNENQTQPIITFPAGLNCYGLKDGIYNETRKIENSNENIENLDPIIIKNGKLSLPVRMKARWRSPKDMKNFFENNCSPTKAKISGIIEEIYFDGDRFNPQIKKLTSKKIESLLLNNKKGSADIEKLDMKGCFSYPKSVDLIKNVLEMSNITDDCVFLDFFSGSATSGQAIYEINAETKRNGQMGKIKYILIQVNDKLNKFSNDEIVKKQIELCNNIGKPHTLDNIGIERIKRAAKLIKEKTNADIDYGFKHYTLVDKAETLDKLESFDPNIAVLTQDDILSEFSIESRLITYLCDDGFGLTPKYKSIDLDGYEAYFIEGFLYLLDKGFDSDQIASLIKKVDSSEIKIKKIIVFGYAFDTRSLQQLKDNVEKMGDEIKDIVIKY